MKSVIEELWYGNIGSESIFTSCSKELKELGEYIAKHREALFATLSDRQKEILEKFNDCYDELVDISNRELFSYAFRIGARMVLEIMRSEI